MSELYLGIDTSNYKTSIALTDENDTVVFERSEFLEVEQGERGLRQSVAFFKQSIALPLFIQEAGSKCNLKEIDAIAVSSRPRRVEGSYMPVFLAGENLARELAAVLSVPLYRFSHQEGHVHAVLTSAGVKLCEGESCIMYHLSGGTTEILLCTRDAQGYKLEIIGGTKDISIGQLLDRFGVKLGCAFPAGVYLDEIASDSDLPEKSTIGIKQDDGWFNLSGIETQALRFAEDKSLDSDEVKAYTAMLFTAIAELIYKTAEYLSAKYQIKDVYLAGGVASSRTVRRLIKEKIDNNNNINIVFGDTKLSGDNAVGTARLGRLIHKER